jgi:hypothetical protein
MNLTLLSFRPGTTTSLQGVNTESKPSLTPGMKAIRWFGTSCNASPQGFTSFRVG